MITIRHCSVLAVALALPARAEAGCPVPGFKYAAFGDVSLSLSGGATTNSYDSKTGTYAATQTLSGGNIGTNSTSNPAITLSGGAVVSGNGDVGFNGNPNTGIALNGGASITSKAALTAPITLSSVTVPSLPNANPFAPTSGSLPPNQTYGTIGCNGNKHLTLNAGKYVMAGLGLNGQCDLIVGSGPIEVYITGTLMKLNGGSVTNATLRSTDLVFLSSTLTDVQINGGATAAFAVYAPNAVITINGNADFYGGLVGKSFLINGGAKLHYDKALGDLGTDSISCITDVVRATPVVATIANQSCVVGGSFENMAGSPTTILTTADVANFVFPFTQGHVRARTTASLGVGFANADSFASGTILFDAGNGIPTANFSGCGKTSSGGFTTSCRNVFTNTNATPASGLTTGQGELHLLDLSDSNATTIGALIASTAQVAGITTDHWKTIVRRVLAGTSNGTVAKLGGVDRSTVAIISASPLTNEPNRPAMAYFGGTDGMLHAVCASTGGVTSSVSSNVCPATLNGHELWAFVPRVQLPLIRLNKARIDGSVRVVDAFGDFNSPQSGVKSWRTILTFQTGFSDNTTKPAVYAIDVTDPAKPVMLWEYVPPTTLTATELGTGLVMHAGATLINGTTINLAVAQTNNGGSGTSGMVVRARKLETGTAVWDFNYTYPSTSAVPPRTNDPVPSTGIPGGAIGVDLTGSGFTTDVVMGDLYGNLWRLNAATGISSTGSATSPLFSFTTDRKPIGGRPAILDNGTKSAVFASGGYTDPTGASAWSSASGQRLIGVKLAPTTSITETSELLTINQLITAGEKTYGQVLVVGNDVFVTTDTSDVNASTYGTTKTATGAAYKFSVTSGQGFSLGQLQGGASALVSEATSLFGAASDKELKLAVSATTGGTKVDYEGNKKATRLVWLLAN